MWRVRINPITDHLLRYIEVDDGIESYDDRSIVGTQRGGDPKVFDFRSLSDNYQYEFTD